MFSNAVMIKKNVSKCNSITVEMPKCCDKSFLNKPFFNFVPQLIKKLVVRAQSNFIGLHVQ